MNKPPIWHIFYMVVGLIALPFWLVGKAYFLGKMFVESFIDRFMIGWRKGMDS